MCCYKTLHLDEDGYVIRCSHCERIQVAFGTTALTLTQGQYRLLTAVVEDMYRKYSNYANPNCKAISLPTPVNTVQIVCTFNELKRLKQLLWKGRNSMEMAKLFVFHDN